MPLIYKLITKMIVHRLQLVLQARLHQRQYAFMPHKQIHNNISNAFIAKCTQQDVLFMQVDMAKTFDCVHWDYISQTMMKMNFGPKWINLIYCYIQIL